MNGNVLDDYYAARLEAGRQAYSECEIQAQMRGDGRVDLLWLEWRTRAQDLERQHLGIRPEVGLSFEQQASANARVHVIATVAQRSTHGLGGPCSPSAVSVLHRLSSGGAFLVCQNRRGKYGLLYAVFAGMRPERPPVYSSCTGKDAPACNHLHSHPHNQRPRVPIPNNHLSHHLHRSQRVSPSGGGAFGLLWIIGGVVAVLLIASCGCCGAIGLVGALTTPKTTPTTVAQASATNTITQAHVQPTATTAPQPTAKPTAVPTSDIVLHLKGTGDKQSSTFTVADTWTVAWTCSGGSTLYIEVYNAGDNSLNFADSVTYDCPSGHNGSDSTVFHDSGTFYLSIIGTSQTYDITVTDTPN